MVSTRWQCCQLFRVWGAPDLGRGDAPPKGNYERVQPRQANFRGRPLSNPARYD